MFDWQNDIHSLLSYFMASLLLLNVSVKQNMTHQREEARHLGVDRARQQEKKENPMKKTLVPITLAFALIAVAPAAFAATASSTLTVQASVAANCTIAAATLNFGPYDPVVTNAVANLDGSTTMAVACTKGFDPIITIPLAGRTMTGAPDTLNYQLFSDPLRTASFGETVLTGFHMGAAPSKAARNVTLYGRVPGGQDVGVAAYSGTIQVSVNF